MENTKNDKKVDFDSMDTRPVVLALEGLIRHYGVEKVKVCLNHLEKKAK